MIRQFVEDIFKALNKLEEVVEKEYTEQRNNANLILQLQALRHTRTILNKAFPYSEVAPQAVMHEDKKEDVTSPLIAGEDEIPKDIPPPPPPKKKT